MKINVSNFFIIVITTRVSALGNLKIFWIQYSRVKYYIGSFDNSKCVDFT